MKNLRKASTQLAQAMKNIDKELQDKSPLLTSAMRFRLEAARDKAQESFDKINNVLSQLPAEPSWEEEWAELHQMEGYN